MSSNVYITLGPPGALTIIDNSLSPSVVATWRPARMSETENGVASAFSCPHWRARVYSKMQVRTYTYRGQVSIREIWIWIE